METIQTFVFFDLETTGLPSNVNPPKITEIAFVSARREDILQINGDISKENNSSYLLPRIINKLTLPVYPCKMITPKASDMSGLTNQNLEHQKAFDEKTVDLLSLFLERLEKPICLVAHNGNRFDFPLLKAEVAKIGQELPEDLLCVDSLPGFRDVFSEKANNAASLVPKSDWSDDEYNEELVHTTVMAERLTEQHSTVKPEEIEAQIQKGLESMRKMNEQTPTRRKKLTARPTNDNGARRNILAEKPKMKFNMKSMYEHITGRELVDGHRAEADALALLECVTAVGLPVLQWMDKNRQTFRAVKKLW